MDSLLRKLRKLDRASKIHPTTGSLKKNYYWLGYEVIPTRVVNTVTFKGFTNWFVCFKHGLHGQPKAIRQCKTKEEALKGIKEHAEGDEEFYNIRTRILNKKEAVNEVHFKRQGL